MTFDFFEPDSGYCASEVWGGGGCQRNILGNLRVISLIVEEHTIQRIHKTSVYTLIYALSNTSNSSLMLCLKTVNDPYAQHELSRFSDRAKSSYRLLVKTETLLKKYRKPKHEFFGISYKKEQIKLQYWLSFLFTLFFYYYCCFYKKF